MNASIAEAALTRNDRRSVPPSPTALVVERPGAARELEVEYLRALGFRVELACDGAAAWESAEANPPDLVVTEILLPRRDGLTLCQKLKSSPETRDVRILVVTMLAAGARAREAGADGFLLKPITADRFVCEVERLVPRPAFKDGA